MILSASSDPLVYAVRRNTKLEIRNSKKEFQYCFEYLDFYAFSVRIYFKFLFTTEAQRTLRVGIFCLSGDDDKQKGLHLEDSE